ncbi:unnamed protein product, partial [Prorocentrum cordatum]
DSAVRPSVRRRSRPAVRDCPPRPLHREEDSEDSSTTRVGEQAVIHVRSFQAGVAHLRANVVSASRTGPAGGTGDDASESADGLEPAPPWAAGHTNGRLPIQLVALGPPLAAQPSEPDAQMGGSGGERGRFGWTCAACQADNAARLQCCRCGAPNPRLEASSEWAEGSEAEGPPDAECPEAEPGVIAEGLDNDAAAAVVGDADIPLFNGHTQRSMRRRIEADDLPEPAGAPTWRALAEAGSPARRVSARARARLCSSGLAPCAGPGRGQGPSLRFTHPVHDFVAT